MFAMQEAIRPSADLRNHYNEISKQCREGKEAVIIADTLAPSSGIRDVPRRSRIVCFICKTDYLFQRRLYHALWYY